MTSAPEVIHYSDLWQGIARAVPDRPAIITADDVWSYGRLAREAGAFACHLQDAGVRAGDAVALLLYNRAEYLAVYWACLAIGAAPVAINYRYRSGEVAALLTDCGAKLLVTAASLAPTAVDAVAAAGTGIPIVTVTDDAAFDVAATGTHTTGYAEIIARGGSLPASAPRGAELRLYTGGTTGMPKGVVWDLDTLLEARRASTWGILGIDPPTDLAAAIDIAVDPATPRIRTLPLPPLLHGTAQSTTMGTLALGGTVVLQTGASLDVTEAVRLARMHEVTRIVVAGDAVALPFVEAVERSGAGLRHLGSVMSSGMRFSDDVKRRLHALGEVMIVDLLASSEGGPFAFGITRSAADLPARFMPTPETVLLDAERNEVPREPGALGILAFGGVLPKGYHGDPVKTAQAFPVIRGHRYVVPGDWARARDDGSIELLGRGSAVVNTGGEKVFPAEVEEALLQHPSVADAVVFGVPDPRFGEVVSAAVVPEPGARVDPAALAAHVDGLLAGYKKPRHYLVRESLDRSQTGKVDLERLRAEAIRSAEAVRDAEAIRNAGRTAEEAQLSTRP